VLHCDLLGPCNLIFSVWLSHASVYSARLECCVPACFTLSLVRLTLFFFANRNVTIKHPLCIVHFFVLYMLTARMCEATSTCQYISCKDDKGIGPSAKELAVGCWLSLQVFASQRRHTKDKALRLPVRFSIADTERKCIILCSCYDAYVLCCSPLPAASP
jgi:hypothetical protein